MDLDKNYLDVFSTPISVYFLKDLNFNQIEKIISKSNCGPHGLLNFGDSSYNLDLPILEHPELEFLTDRIEICISDYTDRTGLKNLKIINSWFNRTSSGHYVKEHRHERSVVSGAFYFNLSEEVSPLIFKSPLFPYKMIDMYEKVTPYSETYAAIKPENGMLIVFPSWLEHRTDMEVGERTVISFNTYFEEHLGVLPNI